MRWNTLLYYWILSDRTQAKLLQLLQRRYLSKAEAFATAIPHVVVHGTYLQTGTSLECMEKNVSGRSYREQ